MTTALLIHGGLWEEVNADFFWRSPGIVAGLERHGVRVLSPDRVPRAASWAAEAEHLAAILPDDPVTVIAGSNGCSAAMRLALGAPDRVERLLLAWPATAGDPEVDAEIRADMAELGASPQVIEGLLAGRTLRGTTDAELATITQPVGLLPSLPHNIVHQRRTVDALLRAVSQAVELPGCPEPPNPAFRAHAEAFVRAAVAFVWAEEFQ